MNDLKPLDAQHLYRHCDPALLDVETSGQLPPPDGIFRQALAVEALHFAIARPGYNLFVLGDPSSNRHDDVRELLQAKTAGNDS